MAASAWSRFTETARALAAPKRLVPIVLVATPLVLAQGRFSRDPLAVPLAIVTCLAFVLIAPFSWRTLFPDDDAADVRPWRLAAYVSIGSVVVFTLGVAVPHILRMARTFLTDAASVAVSEALFLVGGWGLGRDIGFEESLAEARRRAENSAREAERAQLLALRVHFDPHFLFNTLNAIAEWCREDGEVAERAILQLSSMLREMLSGVRAPHWPLSKELGLVRSVFELHAIRDPSAFTLKWESEPGLENVAIPPLLLLPIAENAVKHGPASGARGTIDVSVIQTGSSVRIALENPGRYRGPRAGSDGVPTVERRLRAAYGQDASFSIGPAPGGERTIAVLTIPNRGPDPGVAV